MQMIELNLKKNSETQKKNILSIKDIINQKQEILSLEIKRTVRVSKENFRNEIRINLDKGTADGSKLDKVYNDLKIEQVNIIFETFRTFI